MDPEWLEDRKAEVKKLKVEAWRQERSQLRQQLSSCIRCTQKDMPCEYNPGSAALVCVRCTRAGEKYCIREEHLNPTDPTSAVIHIASSSYDEDEAEIRDILTEYREGLVQTQPGVWATRKTVEKAALPQWLGNYHIPLRSRRFSQLTESSYESSADSADYSVSFDDDEEDYPFDTARTWRDILPHRRNLSEAGELKIVRELHAIKTGEKPDSDGRTSTMQPGHMYGGHGQAHGGNEGEGGSVEHLELFLKFKSRHLPRVGYQKRQNHLGEVPTSTHLRGHKETSVDRREEEDG